MCSVQIRCVRWVDSVFRAGVERERERERGLNPANLIRRRNCVVISTNIAKGLGVLFVSVVLRESGYRVEVG